MKLQSLTFSASSTENDLIHGSTSSSFYALISCSLRGRSLLTYLIVGFRTGPSLVDLWYWTVIGICPACSVALAMEKTLEEEDTLLQAGTIETSDIESKDTLFG
jgi:hypothetical protein